MTQQAQSPLLEVKNLKKYFKIPRKGMLHAVDDVSFEVYPGETLGLVGESGCGKSTVGNVLMRLLPRTSGELIFNGQDVFTANKTDSFNIRKSMQIIFQDPYSSLNPRKTIKSILSEAYEIHKLAKGAELDKAINELCDMVGIARALSLKPSFVVCDEPVSSLDVSVQAKIINLLIDMQKKMDLSYLFISHDLSVVRHISDRIAVMYLGQIVEISDTATIFSNTMHPYSIALLSAVPRVDVDTKVRRILLKGDVPSPMNPKPGCRFAPRCWMAQDSCYDNTPELTEVEPGHCVACHFARQSRAKIKDAAVRSLSDN